MKKFYTFLFALFLVNGASGQSSIPASSIDDFAQSKHRTLHTTENVHGMMGNKDWEKSDLNVEKKSKEMVNHRTLQLRELIQIFDSIYYWQWDTISIGWSIDTKTINMVYDAKNNLTSEVEQKWNSNAWENDEKHTNTYDANNNLTRELTQYWIGSGSVVWLNSSQYIYTYDINNNSICALWQNWNNHNAWENYLQFTSTYDANNNQVSWLWQNWNGSAWVNSMQYIRTYDANNNETSRLTKTWNGNDWVNSYQFFYTYDANNNPTSYLYQNWNGNAWENGWNRTYAYDASNNLISLSGQTWNGSAWVNSSLQTYSYDANNNKTNDLYQNWNGNAWENYQQSTYTYDINNNMTSQFFQNWQNNAWVSGFQQIYAYDANNFTVSESHKGWNVAGTEIAFGDSNYYYFHTALGIDELKVPMEGIVVYPNPSSDKITIETPVRGHLFIHNLNGQQLLHQEIAEPTTTVDVSTLPSGVYVVKLVGEKGVQVGKFIKQ
jgi:hypothetical protein